MIEDWHDGSQVASLLGSQKYTQGSGKTNFQRSLSSPSNATIAYTALFAIAMGTSTFDTVLENIESLSLEDQEALIELVQRRLSDRRRVQIAANIAKAKDEYQSGQVFRGSVEDVIAELNR